MNARSKKQFEAGRPARIEAGERVFRYLAGLPLQTAIAVAMRVEFMLAVEWHGEQRKMLEAGDRTSWVFSISDKHLTDAQEAFMSTPLFGTPLNPKAFAEWQRSQDHGARAQWLDRASDAEQHIVDLLSVFPVDQGWWTMVRVREQIIGWCRVKGAAA